MHPGSLGSWEDGGMWNLIGLWEAKWMAGRKQSNLRMHGLNDSSNTHTITQLTNCVNTTYEDTQANMQYVTSVGQSIKWQNTLDPRATHTHTHIITQTCDTAKQQLSESNSLCLSRLRGRGMERWKWRVLKALIFNHSHKVRVEIFWILELHSLHWGLLNHSAITAYFWSV